MTLYYYAKVVVELKETNKELSYVMVFIMRPRTTLKFKFDFSFNE